MRRYLFAGAGRACCPVAAAAGLGCTPSVDWECACAQTSVTPAHHAHSKLPLTMVWAAYLMATHSNGISALQLQRHSPRLVQDGWLLCAKLRAAWWPRPQRAGRLVEVDETEIAAAAA